MFYCGSSACRLGRGQRSMFPFLCVRHSLTVAFVHVAGVSHAVFWRLFLCFLSAFLTFLSLPSFLLLVTAKFVFFFCFGLFSFGAHVRHRIPVALPTVCPLNSHLWRLIFGCVILFYPLSHHHNYFWGTHLVYVRPFDQRLLPAPSGTFCQI